MLATTPFLAASGGHHGSHLRIVGIVVLIAIVALVAVYLSRRSGGGPRS